MLRSSLLTTTYHLARRRNLRSAYVLLYHVDTASSQKPISLGPPSPSNDSVAPSHQPSDDQQTDSTAAAAEAYLKENAPLTVARDPQQDNVPHNSAEMRPADTDQAWTRHPGHSFTPGEGPPPSEPRPSPPEEQAPSPTYTERLDEAKAQLLEWSTLAHSQFRQKTDVFTKRATTRFAELGGQLNHFTGYEEIEALKKRVVAQEELIQRTREAARESKRAHEEAVALRANSQREVNDLLARKATWSDADVSRFTALVRQDHLSEQAEQTAKQAAAQAEDAVDRAFSELMRAILGRYHEEQVWSDKIRSASTYGSLAVLGINVLVFVLATILIEPWKRRRLARTFEQKVDEMDARNKVMVEGGLQTLAGRLEEQERVLVGMMSAVGAVEAAMTTAAAQAVMVPPSPIEPLPTQVDEIPEDVPLPSSPPSGWASKLPSPHVMTVGAAAFVVGSLSGWLMS